MRLRALKLEEAELFFFFFTFSHFHAVTLINLFKRPTLLIRKKD